MSAVPVCDVCHALVNDSERHEEYHKEMIEIMKNNHETSSRMFDIIKLIENRK